MQYGSPAFPKRITQLLIIVVMMVVIVGVTGTTIEYFAGTQPLVWLVDLDRERNIPALFSTGLLVLCSALIAKIALDKKKAGAPYFAHWTALSVIFGLIALEEALGFHEMASSRLAESVNARGFLYFIWVVPGSVVVFVFVMGYLKFLLALEQRTRWLFLTAGMLYVGGALVMEMLGGRHMDLRGYDMTYVVLVTVEEFLEMLGVVVFIGALISYRVLGKSQIPNPDGS